MRLAKAMADNFNSLDAFVFLRRVAIFHDFALSMQITERPAQNWNSLCSPEALFRRFHIERGVVELRLPLFSLLRLPEDFLGFLLDPFRFDIANNCEFEVGFCLLTGLQIVNPPSSIVVRDTKPMAEVLRDHLAGTYSFFIILTGARAGRVVIGSSEFDWFAETKSCYLDLYGQENREFRTGRMLTLSHTRMELLTDMMLSGSWTDKLIISVPRTTTAQAQEPRHEEPAGQ
jgi:hypothetical protein